MYAFDYLVDALDLSVRFLQMRFECLRQLFVGRRTRQLAQRACQLFFRAVDIRKIVNEKVFERFAFHGQLRWIDSKTIAIAIEYKAEHTVATDVPRNASMQGAQWNGKRCYQNAEMPAIPCAPNDRASRQSARVMPPNA